MASVKEHMKKNQKNKDFAYYIDDTDYSEWEITGLFYAGLHLMNAYLHKNYNINDSTIDRHKKLKKIIESKCTYGIQQKYDSLFKLSLQARYECIDVSKRVEYAKQTLSALENYCIGK